MNAATATAEVVRQQQRLQAAQQRTAEHEARARASAAEAAELARATSEMRTRTRLALEQVAECSVVEGAGDTEPAELEDLEEEIEMLRQQLRAAKSQWKRVVAERDQLLRQLGGGWAHDLGPAKDAPSLSIYRSPAKRLTPSERKIALDRLTQPPPPPKPYDTYLPKPVPRKWAGASAGWKDRKVEKMTDSDAAYMLYERPRQKKLENAAALEAEEAGRLPKSPLLAAPDMKRALERLATPYPSREALAPAAAPPPRPRSSAERPDWCWRQRSPAPLPPRAADESAEVTVPRGKRPGDEIVVRTQDGREMCVTVPQGVVAGQQFVVLIPAGC